MRNQLLAVAIAAVLVAGMTTSAMAFEAGFQNGGVRASNIGDLQSGYSHMRGGYDGERGRNFSGIRGFSSWRQGSWRSRHFVGGYRGYN